MSFLRSHAKLLAVGVSCVALGAGASVIASAGAATSSGQSAGAAKPQLRARLAAWRRAARGTVQATAVVHTKSGFRTITLERGYVQSVSGNTLVMREATRNATYRTVTIAVPADAKVRNDRQSATLAQLRSGEHVLVVQGLPNTWVIARGAT